jgi:hypothetical protein
MPPEIDLTGETTSLEEAPITHALAAFAAPSTGPRAEVLLLAPDGTLRRLPVPDLQPVQDPNGDARAREPETSSMLSPDGRTLMFPQDHAVELYEIAHHTWKRIDVTTDSTFGATWVQDDQGSYLRVGSAFYDASGGSIGIPPVRAATPPGTVPYGPFRIDSRGAVSVTFSSALPAGPGIPTLQGMVVTPARQIGGPSQLLLYANPVSAARPDDCCSVAGWADQSVVAYESRLDASIALVAWRPGTHEFGLLTTVTGLTAGADSYVASWGPLAPQ